MPLRVREQLFLVVIRIQVPILGSSLNDEYVIITDKIL